MARSLPHSIDEIQALVQKLIDKDIVRQKAIMELAVQFDNASTAKDDLRKAYEKCNDIPQESRALIDTFFKEEADKDYEMNLSIESNPPTPEKPLVSPISSFSTGGSSSQQHTHQPMSPLSSFPTVEESTDEHEIGDEYLTDGYLTEKEQHQLLLDEEALRETLEEEARAEKEWEERIRQEQAHDELFMLEFVVKSDSEYESD
ncbi:hypothetical protein Tco_1217582 [Tanacetum coccineum]